jgi:hypothetical protein
MMKKEKFDGRSRPSNQAYEESWHRIFGEKTHEERVKELKTSPMYREYRDRQNAMARARRKDKKNDGR